MRSSILYLVGLVAFLGILAGGTRACNSYWNNRDVTTLGRRTISHTTGLIGHNELTIYSDGFTDLKIYPGIIGHRYTSSKLYQDLDGDGRLDRIRVNGPEWKMHKLETILVREVDYTTHKDEFDKADKLLVEERRRTNK